MCDVQPTVRVQLKPAPRPARGALIDDKVHVRIHSSYLAEPYSLGFEEKKCHFEFAAKSELINIEHGNKSAIVAEHDEHTNWQVFAS